MDGLKVSIEEAPDEIVQSRFYNGWKSDHFVTGVLGFAPDGTIPVVFTMFWDAVMIIQLLTGEISIRSWKWCIFRQV